MMFSAVFLSENVSCLLDNIFMCDSVRLDVDDKFSLTDLQNFFLL